MKKIFGISLLLAVAAPLTADDNGLQTSAGTPLKVVVREHAALYDRPEKTSPNKPVRQFEFFYVLPAQDDTNQKLRNGFYRVGTSPRLGAHVGWLPQEIAVEWAHVQIAGLRPNAGREQVLFFASRQDAENWFKGDSSVQPISREPAKLVGSQLFPLLDVSNFSHKGEEVQIYRVAYLSAAAASSPSLRSEGKTASPEGISLAQLQSDLVLEVVFVIDTTASMEPFIEAMKKVIATIVEELSRDPALRRRVRFGLVCYRDQLEHEEDQRRIEYVTKIVCDLKAGRDHQEFLKRLADVHEAKIGSEDTPEDGLAGLKVTIQEAGWDKLAAKHIVWIGDASAQTDLTGYKNLTKSTIPGILALAQPTGDKALLDKIQIHGLRIVGQDPSDHQRCQEHFEQLTKGRDFPGLHYGYRGTDDAAKFVADLTARLRQLADYTGKVASGKFQELEQEVQKAAPGSSSRVLGATIMEMLKAAGSGGDGRSPTFTEGFAVVIDRQGNKALEPHVLVTHGRMSLFASALDFSVKSLENAGEPGKRDVQKVVSSLQILATQVNLGESVSPDMPLQKLLSAVLGFPVRNPIFQMTPNRLAAMSSADFNGWTRQDMPRSR